MGLYGKTSLNGRFGLANRDFGAHNLLVDNKFEIVGVIDLDGVMAAPIETIAQFPQLTELDRETPEHNETRPAALERIARVALRLVEYRDLVREAEKSLGEGQASPIADCIMSDAASVIQGPNHYGGHQASTNDRWMAAYEMLLQKA